jgi:hypothetical protein
MAIEEDHVRELLRKKGEFLYHREGQELEFKEQFNLAGLADYFKDFAAFANNRGGYLIFGVQDSPRIPSGLRDSALAQFNKVDPEKISGFLLELFSSDIRWDQADIERYGRSFGVFRVYEAAVKPVIARKNEGKGQLIRSGDIYYRYGGRTQLIQHAELESIIADRIDHNNRQWQALVQRIGQTGPQNAAILDTERALIEKQDGQIIMLDEQLANKLRFLKEGEFVEAQGAEAMKLVGDIVPVKQVEIIKRVKENLYKDYPLSAMQLASEVKIRLPYVHQHQVWQAIKENGLKDNPAYSKYVFRNKSQEDEYEQTGEAPAGLPSIYKPDALEFLINVLKRN